MRIRHVLPNTSWKRSPMASRLIVNPGLADLFFMMRKKEWWEWQMLAVVAPEPTSAWGAQKIGVFSGKVFQAVPSLYGLWDNLDRENNTRLRCCLLLHGATWNSCFSANISSGFGILRVPTAREMLDLRLPKHPLLWQTATNYLYTNP